MFSYLQCGHHWFRHCRLQVWLDGGQQSAAVAAHQRALLCDAHPDVAPTVLLRDCGQLSHVSADRELLQVAGE